MTKPHIGESCWRFIERARYEENVPDEDIQLLVHEHYGVALDLATIRQLP